MTRNSTACVECNSAKGRRPIGLRCAPCNRAYHAAMFRCNAAITLAIARKQLPRAKTQACKDCGAQAHDWEHRDYSKPLEVEPVCRRCNMKRGPAAWRPAPSMGALLEIAVTPGGESGVSQAERPPCREPAAP